MQCFGAQVASQPLANGIANRPAGRSIDRVAGIVDSAVHRQFLASMLQHQVTTAENVSCPRHIRAGFIKTGIRAAAMVPGQTEKAPAGAEAPWNLKRLLLNPSMGFVQ
jgi:hypothetical protein